ncbi:MAG: PD-(D/E)XK nuclease family protein [Bacteroidales bacterium]|nr:PD-(D/E)XK nuclease family protein [Bacteroidales bacterium]
MTKEELIKTLDSLIGIGFKPDIKEISYNPMQEFTDYVSTKEIVHSRIIADMLDAKAKHNMGRCFLDLVLERVGFEKTLFSSVNIKTEKMLKGEEWDGRRIDILVEDIDNNCALVIENKLNGASYQPKQLEHYRKAMEEKYSSSNIKVLCLHRDKSIKDDNIEFCDKILYPHELAQMIKTAVALSETKEWVTILSYAKYLDNLHRSNIDFENSNLLASDTISAETITSVKKIVETYGPSDFKSFPLDYKYTSATRNLCDAFQDLNNAYARRLIKSVSKINGANMAETEEGYPHYAAIWNEEKYQKTRQWLSVGFSGNTVYFYLVSNQQDDANNRDSRAKEAGFENPSYYARQGYYWYKPRDIVQHTMSFDNKPDMDKIIKRVEEMLDSLSKVK